MEELKEVSLSDDLVPLIGVDVDKRANDLNLKILIAFFGQLDELLEVLFINVSIRNWSELREVSDNSEQQDVVVLECSLDELLKLVVLRHDLSTFRLSCQVDSK